MNNQFSQKVSDILIYSKEEAERLRNNYIGPEHLLLGLIRDGEGKAIDLLSKFHVNLQDIKKEIEALLLKENFENLVSGDEIVLNESAARVLKLCILEARLLKSNIADSEHILLAILKDKKNLAAKILEQNDIYYSNIFELISLKPDINSGLGFNGEEDEEVVSDRIPGQNNIQQSQQQKVVNDTPVIDSFGVDLTRAAEDGKLDPVVGREKEIERLAQILSRRKKNNPILIGEPGVGKSAIVEGLANRIVEKKVSRVLFDKRVIVLDLTAVVAGTKYRGQFEERIRSILSEVEKNSNIILFIDEIHTIIGAGSAPGSMDAANMLKPALARGEIQCIGATTLDEFRKTIEKDGALERRFQKVIVEATTTEETLQILNNIKGKYEEHHNVIYTEAALHACVHLTERYITDRCFPDKAIDVLDEAGSRVHLINVSAPKEIEDQEKLIDEFKLKKNEAVKLQNYELAASYRDKEKELTTQLETLKHEWEERLKEKRELVDENQIAEVVSMMSGVPVQRMAQVEGVRLQNMKADLKCKVIAQDAAIEKLVKAVQRSRIGLKDPNRPIGTFMFLGPTGVGKTLLAKELAEYMFGSSDALIRIDMSEYMDKFTVSRLVGAPPGYVGYEEGGQLTEKVRRHPYSIILLDELEKAHSDVYNILLQVMDEGRLTDSYGRTVDFRNTIIIMTSNVGTRQVRELGRGIGFTNQNFAGEAENSRNIIQKALNKSFAPEFINRIDEIITFDPLTMESINQIVDLELKGVAKRLKTIGYNMSISNEAKRFVATKGYDMQYGARPLKRSVQTYVEDGIAELLVNGDDIPENATILVDVNKEDDEKLTFTLSKMKG